MPTLAVVIVLASALLHATWNVLLAKVPNGVRRSGIDTTAVAVVIGLIAWTPLALLRWRVEAGAWPYLAASAALQLAYFAALNLAYARAPAHTAYPVARGLGPVLLLPLAAVAAGGVPVAAAVGVLAISGGVLLTAWGGANRRSVLYAIPVALCIAGYTFIDARGLRFADPAPYLWLSMVPVAAVLLAVRGRRLDVRAELRPATVVMGLGMYAAYGLTLAALALVSPAQVPGVAALRETSILFVLALSWFTRRAARPTTLSAGGAVLIFAGVAALALS
jgi:hypothetical protein